MRIVFLGSPIEVLAPLRALLAQPGFEVVGVVSQPAKPVGRKRILSDPPVASFSKDAGIPTLQPESAQESDFLNALRLWKPDVAVTAAYGQILNEEFLAIPKRATINIHPSLLPIYRGATPVQSALLNGDLTTGVSILFTVKRLDAGAIITSKTTSVLENECTGKLTQRLFAESCPLLISALDSLRDPSFQGSLQDESQVTRCKKINKTDGCISWSESMKLVHQRWQAFTPWPGVFTFLLGKRILIETCKWEKADDADLVIVPKIGALSFRDSDRSVVVYGPSRDKLVISQLKWEGGSSVSASEFWNGLKSRGLSHFVFESLGEGTQK